jgi:1,4-dihydroxy-2-naphthoate octaprenyltransferase
MAQSVIANWGEILTTQNLRDFAPGKPLDPVSRWLLITRASVFPMTLTSGMLGGLLAVGAPGADWGAFALALVGLMVAHAANNMINDYFDLDNGVDTEGYVRTVYAPHPLLSGLISKRGLQTAILAANVIDLAILVWLTALRGPAVVAFALAGLFVSVGYVAPPVKLKHRGLGEPGVFVVWGPLMIGGTYYVTTGSCPMWVLAASIPYALLVTVVLFGKHVDKHDGDKAKGIHTLPVILGKDRARAWSRAMMIGFFPLVVALVAAGVISPWCLLVFAALPRLRETLATFREPKPEAPPEGYPIWPLWFVAWAFRLTRQVGGLFILGLVIDAVWPLRLG